MKTNLSRNFLAALMVLSAAFAFSGCEKETLRGHGDTVTRTRTVGTFNKIDMGGEFEVYLTQGPAEDIVMEGQENVLADIRTTTLGNRLKVDFRSSNVKIKDKVRIYITTPDLTEISMSGCNTVKGLTDWQVNDLKLESSGSGSIALTLKGADFVESEISGSGQIDLAGEAFKHELEISGSGKLKAFDFYTSQSEVKISGSGRADLRVAEKLKATISGSGKVRYKGNPSVNASVSGSGSVTKED